MRTESTARTLVGVDIQERKWEIRGMLSLLTTIPNILYMNIFPWDLSPGQGKKRKQKKVIACIPAVVHRGSSGDILDI